MSDVAVVENNRLMDSDILNPQISIEDRLALAGDVAAKFKHAIQTLGLIHKIKGNDYVTVSGWSTLGTMIGIHVENIEVEPFPTQNPRGFAYKAKVDLVDKNGVKIGEGAGICSNSGYQKEDHAVYSMAITRATGKAYRLSLAWLVEMAGYNPTPYEEMPESMTVNGSVVNDDDEDIKSLCYEIKNQLELEGKPVTKSSMRSMVVSMVNAGDLDKKQRPELIKYIDRHCPEELE